MVMNKPYFMNKEDWFYYDEEEFFAYRLTNKAPKEAYESYKNYLDDSLKTLQIDEQDYDALLEELKKFEEQKAKELFGL